MYWENIFYFYIGEQRSKGTCRKQQPHIKCDVLRTVFNGINVNGTCQCLNYTKAMKYLNLLKLLQWKIHQAVEELIILINIDW